MADYLSHSSTGSPTFPDWPKFVRPENTMKPHIDPLLPSPDMAVNLIHNGQVMDPLILELATIASKDKGYQGVVDAIRCGQM